MSILRKLSLFALLFLAAWSLRASPAEFPANPDSARRGIAKLRIEREGKVLAVDVMGPNKRIAKLMIEFDTPEGSILNLKRDGSWLRIAWSQQTGRVSVTDPATRESASRTVALKPKKAMTTEGDGQLFEKYKGDLELAFTVYDQVLIDVGLYEFFRKQVPAAREPGDKIILRCPPACDGPLIEPVAIATGLTRCCTIATNDANVLCSNSLCIGCCQILGCDAACAIGDGFACVCAVLGRSCSEPVLGCDNQWPPECI
ncbi:MAG TPA: hypothetical protein VKK31_28190 [Thermoanaerobaculia bacterium]|nr:hypothetical protein [Thermoanaerobaculia bacterium]